MKTIFSVMLAHHLDEAMSELRTSTHYPLYASFKYDGIRGLNNRSRVVSRSDKPLPSGYIQQEFASPLYEGFDGEFVPQVLRPGLVYKDAFSAVMTHGCTTPVDWHIFDHHTNVSWPFEKRYELLQERLVAVGKSNIKLIEQRLCRNWGELLEYEKVALDLGFEGLVVRRRDAPYKYGRSTGPQQYLMAMVRIAKSECEITGFYEGLSNTNVAVIDSRGYTTRSKHLAQMVGKDSLGGFNVRDIHYGWEFNIGVADGLDHAGRLEVWQNQSKYLGRVSKYKYKPYGMDAVPRQPVMLWGEWRSPLDLGGA